MNPYRPQMIERPLVPASVGFRLRYSSASLVDEIVVSWHITESYTDRFFGLHCERDQNRPEVILDGTQHLCLSIDRLSGSCVRITGIRRTCLVRT